MPLIIISGFPCSGKTYRAQQIIENLFSRTAFTLKPTRNKTIIHIPSQHAQFDNDHDTNSTAGLRDQIYNSAAAEKNARAAEFSAIKRAVNKDTIVVADGLNYIKGYRYQLWCEAKAVGTRCCVVHVAAREDECITWNEERMGEENGILESDRDATTESVGNKNGTGKTVAYGDLMPESHTAIYGDRAAPEARSRSSSIEVQLEVDPPEQSLKYFSLRDDGLTAPSLQSLSIEVSAVPSIPSKTNDHPTVDGNPHDIETTTNLTTPNATTTFPSPSPPYSPETLRSLILRYEPPSPFSRWDTPLFTIPSSDAHPPYDAIWAALFPETLRQGNTLTPRTNHPSTKRETSGLGPVKPHAATVLPPSTSSNALQTLERATQDMTKHLMTWWHSHPDAHDSGGTATVSLPAEEENSAGTVAEAIEIEIEIEIPPSTTITQPMLQRLRRKYTQVQRAGIAHGREYVLGGRRGVAEGFGRFLEGEFGE